MVSAGRHSKDLASSAMVKRTASVARLGLFFRSRYKASCFRRNRFSAASAPRERSPVLNTVSTSNNTRKEVRKNFASWGRFSMADKYYIVKRLIFLSDQILAEHRYLAAAEIFRQTISPNLCYSPPSTEKQFPNLYSSYVFSHRHRKAISYSFYS